MSIEKRFGLLERKRATREQPATKLEQRFTRLGDAERARPPAPASALPVEEVRSLAAGEAARPGTQVTPPPPWPPGLDRLLALALAVWAGSKLLRLLGRIFAVTLVLGLLLLLLGAGVLGRGCAVMRGEVPAGALVP